MINYRIAHKNVKKIFGKASEYPCVELICRRYARDWSLDRDEDATFDSYPVDIKCHRPFSESVYNYSPRCKSCHIRYDHTGSKRSAETRAKQSAAWNYSEKRQLQTAKISAANKGRPKSAEHRAKIGKAHKGKILSVEHREKISVAKGGLSAKEKKFITECRTNGVSIQELSDTLGIGCRQVYRIISKNDRSDRRKVVNYGAS